MELNLEGSLEEIKNSGITDEWFLNAMSEQKKKCYAVSTYLLLFVTADVINQLVSMMSKGHI